MVLGNIPEINFHFIDKELNYFILFNFIGKQTGYIKKLKKKKTQNWIISFSLTLLVSKQGIKKLKKKKTQDELHPMNLTNDDEHKHRTPIQETP